MNSPLRRFRVALFLGAGVSLLSVGPAGVAAQVTGTVRGTVTDATTGRLIDGAQVFVLGTDLGTLTNSAGEYQLNLPAGSVELRVRRLGFASMTRRATVVAGQTATFDFQIRAAVIGLDAVVVTGAGAETEKRKLGNTIATIDATELRNAPVQNVSEQLAARHPGVSVLPSGGLAGEGARIRIRGAATLSQPNEPIVYIDGIRVDRTGGFGDLVGTGGGGNPSRLDDINPEAIERIEILKGAAAATLYGTEASAGVIQVFTKTGSRGAPRWDFVTEQGFATFPDGRYKLNAGFARWATWPDCVAAGNDTIPCQTTLPVADRLSQFYGTTIQPFQVFERPFVSDLFETGYHSNYSAAVSGGTNAVTYYANLRLQRENGPFGGEHLGPARDISRKVQGSASLVILPTDNVKIRINSQYVDASHQTPSNNNNIFGTISAAIFGKPELASCTTPGASSLPTGDGRCVVADSLGNPVPGTIGPGNPFGQSAFATVRENFQEQLKQDVKHFTGSVNLAYEPFPELSLEGTVGVDVVSQISSDFFPFGWNVDGFTGFFTEGLRVLDNRTRRELTGEVKATWTRRLGQDWQSQFVAGGQGFITRLVDEGGQGEAFPGPGLEVTQAGANQNTFERFLSTVNAGAFAQEQLSYRDWAFLTVGGRYDRNSAFGRTSDGVFYPKVSVSVLPSALPGWGGNALTSGISTLRVRAAVGQSGLQPGAFDKLTTFSPLPSEAGPGLQPENLGNPDLKPEISTEWEAGAEIGVLGDRAALDVTYWDRVTRDALFPRQFPVSGGFRNTQLANIARIESHGWEIGLTALPVNRPDFSLRLHANAAFLRELVRTLGGAPPLKVSGPYPRTRNFVIEGYAPGSLFGAKLVQPCSQRPAGATYACLNPGQLPYDVTNAAGDTLPDGVPDTEQDLLLYFSRGWAYSLDKLNPLRVDEDGDGDFHDHFLGKSTPDWAGSFGLRATVLRNVEVGSLFEYKFGNYTITNLTDGFRQANPVIGRNIRAAAEVEAAVLNPASTPEQRLEAAEKWLRLKALTPYDGLNQSEKGDFVRWRELSVTYNVPTRWVEQRLGVRYLSLTASVRNVALWTGYRGIDPELNWYGRGGAASDLGGIDNNFLDGVDAFGLALPRRVTFSVRFGF